MWGREKFSVVEIKIKHMWGLFFVGILFNKLRGGVEWVIRNCFIILNFVVKRLHIVYTYGFFYVKFVHIIWILSLGMAGVRYG